MPRRARKWPFIAAFVGVVILPQLVALPHVLRLAARVGGTAAAVALGLVVLALNSTIVLELRGGRHEKPLPRAALLGLMVPFYVWWAGAVASMLALGARFVWLLALGTGPAEAAVLPAAWVVAP